MSEVVTGDISELLKRAIHSKYVACDEAPTFRYNDLTMQR